MCGVGCYVFRTSDCFSEYRRERCPRTPCFPLSTTFLQARTVTFPKVSKAVVQTSSWRLLWNRLESYPFRVSTLRTGNFSLLGTLLRSLSGAASHAALAEQNSCLEKCSQSNRTHKMCSETNRNVTAKLRRFLCSRASYLACLPVSLAACPTGWRSICLLG